eukprot:g5306.t1
MNTIYSIMTICLALSCASAHLVTGHHRTLLQSPPPAIIRVRNRGSCTVINGRCYSRASTSTLARNDVQTRIASALTIAIAEAEGDGDISAAADAVAQAVARAYAVIITNHVAEVFVDGERGIACSYVSSNARAYANAVARATSRAFATSLNDYTRAAAECVSRAVSDASVTAIQNISFGTCTTSGYDYIYERLITVRYAEAIAVAFSSVFSAIRNNDRVSETLCDSTGSPDGR